MQDLDEPIIAPKMLISSKEMTLIDILDSGVQSQRSIARASGFSLGMTNLLLKRLAKKGYIKIINLNGKALRYILTPQGFAKKMKRSYDFIISSIRYLNNIKNKILLLIDEQNLENKYVLIVGRNELANMIYEILKEAGIASEIVDSAEMGARAQSKQQSVVLLCELNSALLENSEVIQNINIIEISCIK